MRKDLLDSFNSLLKQTKDESDRGMVLSMSAFMEDLLGQIIQDFLVDVSTTNDLVNGFNAPLGVFSARIKAAYSLGLISERQYKDINLVRKIRNEFAHSWAVSSLDDQKLHDLLSALSAPTINPGALNISNHLKFQYCAAELLITLEFIHEYSKKNRLTSAGTTKIGDV